MDSRFRGNDIYSAFLIYYLKGNKMELYKKIPWQHNSLEYEIRIMFSDKLINILAFKDNYPQSGFRYQVQVPKSNDVKKILETADFTHIVEAVKDDIREDRWDKLLKQN